jgi:hypothetical protein
MKLSFMLTVMALLAGVVTPKSGEAQDAPVSAMTHTRNEFTFVAKASYERVFPLFGAWEEKKWAEGWEPQFVYPTSPSDQPGMVFTIAHGGMKSVWTNTAFDAAGGHVQYVYVIPDALVTLVDIHLTKAGVNETQVSVVYERTALSPEANDHVAHLVKGDAKSGPDWEEAINGYLARASTAPASSK